MQGRVRRVAVAFTAVAVTLLGATPALAAVQFVIGPAVRVNPNVSVDFKWTTDVAWLGKVDVYMTPDGAGARVAEWSAVDGAGNPISATQQDVVVPLAGPLGADTTYYFRVTATDPSNNLPDIVTPTPLPPFYSGVQAL